MTMLEQMLFMRRGRRYVDAHRWRLDDDHQTSAAALTELLPPLIRGAGLLAVMGNCAWHLKKEHLVLCVLNFEKTNTKPKHKGQRTNIHKIRDRIFVPTSRRQRTA